MSLLINLRDEWNGLVPVARARGINVRLWGAIPTTADYGRCRVEWLRGRIAAANGHVVALPSVTAAPLPVAEAPLPAHTFGVEFEYISPLVNGVPMTRSALAARLTAAGIPAHEVRYGHTTPVGFWAITTDNTVGYSNGELVSPILTGADGLAVMRRACEVMVAAGCTINRYCGFHVHVGIKNHNMGPRSSASPLRNLVRLYGHFENAIDGVMAMSRRGRAHHTMIAPVPSTADLDACTTLAAVVRTFNRGNRYCKINLAAYGRHGTVEFRHHGGTIEPDKAEMWVRLVLRMVAAAKLRTALPLPAENGLDSLLTLVGATPRERDYFRSRATHFAAREGRPLPVFLGHTVAPIMMPAAAPALPAGPEVAPTTLSFSRWMREVHPDIVFSV